MNSTSLALNVFRYNKRAKSRTQLKKDSRNETSPGNQTLEQGKSSVIRNDSILTPNWETKTNQTWLKARTNGSLQNVKNKSSNVLKQKKENEGYETINNKDVKDGVKKKL